MDFSEKAKEILKKVLHEYRNRPKWNKKTLGEMVDFYIAKYNEDVKKEIEDELYKRLGSFYFINDNPQIAVTPVMLSEMLYKNAKDTAKMITKTLYEGIKAKETVRDIAMRIYAGYDFREEVMKARKVLPKYLLKALEKRDAEIIKQIEKLKTKPLRIAYKDLIRNIDSFTDEELQKFLSTAYHEKMRYYAHRIAKTETHRAFMSMRAKDMLEDKEVEFVKYEMSPAHKKTDICDFYANLDVGYGRGVVPKNEMRTLPLHPHCYCIYTPYYKKVKGKRKSWKRAVKETMSKFDEKKQIEILGSREKLMRFKAGEDIEKIFNAIRPKYPIRKYTDIFKGVKFSLQEQSFNKEDVLNFNKMLNTYTDEKLLDEFIKKKNKFKKLFNLTDVELKAISFYQFDDGYQIINPFLRKGIVEGEKEYIISFDKILRSGIIKIKAKQKVPKTVYRFSDFDINELKEGNVIKFGGYVSTTTKRHIVDMLGENLNGYVFKIRLTKGNGAYVGHLQAFYTNEFEYLMLPDTEFKILKIDNDRKIIELEEK